jgi:RNA polymerase sigma-70 factor, ECF subfamily
VSPIPTDRTAETEDWGELVTAAQAGDRRAFEELVRATYVDTYTLALRLTANEEDARDVVQEVYLRAWKGIGAFRGDSQFSTWLYRITANASSTSVSRRRRHRQEPLESVQEPAEERVALQPEPAAESAATLERLADAVAELPPKLRAIVVLKDVYGMSHEAIADELGISVSAAKVRLHRARRKLRDVWLDEGRLPRAM